MRRKEKRTDCFRSTDLCYDKNRCMQVWERVREWAGELAGLKEMGRKGVEMKGREW